MVTATLRPHSVFNVPFYSTWRFMNIWNDVIPTHTNFNLYSNIRTHASLVHVVWKAIVSLTTGVIYSWFLCEVLFAPASSMSYDKLIKAWNTRCNTELPPAKFAIMNVCTVLWWRSSLNWRQIWPVLFFRVYWPQRDVIYLDLTSLLLGC